jgi:hypothetical protein
MAYKVSEGAGYSTMVGILALYYRSLETAPTLLRRGNISG